MVLTPSTMIDWVAKSQGKITVSIWFSHFRSKTEKVKSQQKGDLRFDDLPSLFLGQIHIFVWVCEVQKNSSCCAKTNHRYLLLKHPFLLLQNSLSLNLLVKINMFAGWNYNSLSETTKFHRWHSSFCPLCQVNNRIFTYLYWFYTICCWFSWLGFCPSKNPVESIALSTRLEVEVPSGWWPPQELNDRLEAELWDKLWDFFMGFFYGIIVVIIL